MDSVGNLALFGNHGETLLALAEFLPDEVLALVDDLAVCLALALAGEFAGQAAFREHTLAAGSDLLHSLHGSEGSSHKVAVVLDGDVSLLGELGQDKRRIHDHLLSAGGTVSLGPLKLAGLTLHLEVLVALGPTEAELSGIVADECDALTREGRAGTEVTSFNTADKMNISIP